MTNHLTTERAERVLAKHQRRVIPGGPCCCGEWPPADHDVPWTAHVAAELARAGCLAGPVLDDVEGLAEAPDFTLSEALEPDDSTPTPGGYLAAAQLRALVAKHRGGSDD